MTSAIGLTQSRKINITSTITPEQLHQSYFLIDRHVSFINFNDLTEAEALEVLRWRNHPQIRSCMYHKEEITTEEHFRFLENLSKQQKKFYWIIKEKERTLGVIDIVDFQNLHSEWGFYLNPDYFGKGLSINLLHHALNFFFRILKFQGLYGFCHYQNIRGLMFHDVFGIQHTGYEKIQTPNGDDWYSKRVISAKNWLKKNDDIETIRYRQHTLKTFNDLEEKKIKLDQIFIEVFDMPPSNFYRKANRVSYCHPTQITTLQQRVHKAFGVIVNDLYSAEDIYYSELLKHCL